MEVSKDFKPIAAGEIPSFWEVKSLIDCCDYADYRGKTPKKTSSGRFLVTARNVRDGFIDYDASKEFVADDQYEQIMRRGKPRIGDVLITTEAPLGNVAQVDREDVALAQRIIKYRPKNDDLCPTYLKFYLLSKPFQNLLNSNASGSTAKGIKGSVLHQLPVVIPSPPEQRAMVEVLNDADALIETLDKLISKKRDLKIATMQQLLTGRKQLPGFSDKWEAKRLGDIGVFLKGKGIKKDEVGSEGLPCIRYGEIYTHHDDYVRAFHSFITPAVARESQRITKGDLLFAGSGETADEIGKCVAFLGDEEVYAGGDIVIFSPDAQDSRFLAYLMNHPLVTRQKARMAQGDAVVHISATNLGRLEFEIPEEPEQRAIATLLLDMDVELDALERRCAKTRAVKQGMMQELLTGKIRLAVPKSHTKAESTRTITSTKQRHNWEFNEAVVISVLAKQFGSPRFPLGRKRYTKLAYMLHRHVEREARGYLKKAAGPYNPKTKYKGPEAIAQKRRYVRTHNAGRFSGFVAADNIVEAQNYFQRWYGPKVLPWLEQFRFKKNDELELLATIDMAIQDLLNAQLEVTLRSVKKIIRNHKEWRAKLQRPLFADAKIAAAIETCKKLFG